MTIQKYAGLLQGIGLPKFSQTATILSVATLSKWQQGWRIKHPQAVTRHRKICNHSPIPGSLPGIYPYLGAWVGSQRKRPHCALVLCGAVVRLPDPPWSFKTKESPHDLHLLRYPQSWPYCCAACYPYCFRLCHQRGPSPHPPGWPAVGIPEPLPS